MDLNAIRIVDYSANEMNAPVSIGFGIEVEAEEFLPQHRAPEARALGRYWNIKDDGSLRNSGVEFVSKFLPPENIEPAVSLLYDRTRRLWQPSVRTGIHVHANALHMTYQEVLHTMQYYAFAEPLMFHMLGTEREENIYCVPWYRAPSEAALVAAALRSGDMFGLRQSCKYSALFCGPLRSFGTLEFRHAPTFPLKSMLDTWIAVVIAVSTSYVKGDPLQLYADGGLPRVLETMFGDAFSVFRLTMDEATALIEELGADEVALSLQAPTHKPDTPWGTPGSFYVEGEVAQPYIRNSLLSSLSAEIMPRSEEDDEPENDDEYEPSEPDYEPEEG